MKNEKYRFLRFLFTLRYARTYVRTYVRTYLIFVTDGTPVETELVVNPFAYPLLHYHFSVVITTSDKT